MGSSSRLPGPHKSGAQASVNLKSHQRATSLVKAPRILAPLHGLSSKRAVDGTTRAGSAAYQTRDAIFIADAQTHRIVDVNASASLLMGYSRAELIGAPLSMLVAPGDRAAQKRRIATSSVHPSLISQIQYRHKRGALIDIEIEQRRLEDGRILGVLRSASQGEVVKRQFSQMLTRFDLFVATLDRDARISYANAALYALSGWPAGDLMGRPIYELLPIGTPPGPDQPLSDDFLVSDLEHPVTAELVTRSGNRRSVALSAVLLRDGAGVILGAVIMGQDVTQDRAAQWELEQKLRDRAEVAGAIARLRPRESTEETARAICTELCGLDGADFSVLMVFSASGEATVLAVVARESLPLSAGDQLPPARAAYLLGRAAMGPWAERWRQRAEDGAYGEALTQASVQSVSYAPICYGNQSLGLLLVGSVKPEKADATIENLSAIAEFGSAASTLLALDLQAERVAAENHARIQTIIDKTAYRPVFQPIVDANTRRVVGYEALTRFADGVPPDIRFSTAWSVDLGAELEFATLGLAIRVARGLPEGPWLNLNISPRLLTETHRLRTILSKADRPLVLEVTEHHVITDYGAVRSALQQLGPIRVAVDDAGAGTATFGHIVELQPDFIKVDIGLIRGVNSDPARQAMVVALAHFARVTGSELIAEGVETRAEATTLNSLGGVAFAQGYWYGRPADLEAVIAAPSRALAAVGR
jgi:PAS domain S-box-containing protein